MEAPPGAKVWEELEAVGKSPRVLPGGHRRGFLQRTLGNQIKEEPGEGFHQLWEAQLQEFLKTLESPHSGLGTTELPEPPKPWGDAQAFLVSFEQVAEACRWPKEEWAARLLPALSGEAERAFHRLEAQDREDYGKVKAAILRGDALSREKQRQHFRHFCYQEAAGPRGAYSQLRERCCRWLKVEKHSKEQILELLVLEQLLTILPLEVQTWVREVGPETCSQAVALAEDFLLRQQEAERQKSQVLIPLGADAAVSNSEAKQPLSDTGWTPFSGDTRPERQQAPQLLAKRWSEGCEEGKYAPEVGPHRRSVGKAEENIPQDHVPEVVSGNEPRLGDQREACPEEINRETFPCGNTGVEIPIYPQTLAGCSQVSEHKEYNPPEGPEVRRYRGYPGTHRRIHVREMPFHCAECGKNFSRKHHLMRHQLIHTGEKPFKCSACGKTFVQISDLTRHERTHTGEKPYRCTACGKSFSRKSVLLAHLMAHTGEKPYTCLLCGKRFRSRQGLIHHKTLHAREKAYKCAYCTEAFSLRPQLILHERMHAGEKPYRCTTCGKSFSNSTILTKHEMSHAGTNRVSKGC
ncbi:zinc finger protein 397-like [Varanus komodoensis]|uniref:zinc finger protein 397-like n=1 Tax=Varanus komodoensis TaxID=61221 RepID=UPI001CF79FA4|nr:zinc finger protein 397-like [Varanus komodoensis]